MRLRGLIGIVVLVLAGCSGGGGDPGECFASAETCSSVEPSPPGPVADSAVGFYFGTADINRFVFVVVRAEGDFWLFSTPTNSNGALAAVQTGPYTAANGSINSASLADFNAAATGVARGSMSGTYTTAQSLAATVSLPTQAFAFTASYDPTSTTTNTVTAVVGSYTGTAVVPGSQGAATATVDASGGLTGSTAAGCTFSGALQTVTGANWFTVNLSFLGAACPQALNSGTGVAFIRSDVLYLAVLNAGQTQGFAFSGSP